MIGLVSLVLKDPAALFWLTVVPPGQGTDKGGAGLLLKLSAVPMSLSWEGRGDGERTQQPELRIPAAGRRMAMMGMDRGQIASGPAAAARAAPSKLPQKPTPSKQRP